MPPHVRPDLHVNILTTTMADRCEADVFQQYISELQVGFQCNLSALAAGFFSKKLISKNNWERVLQGLETPQDKAFGLLKALHDRVSNDPPAFHTILEVIHAECPELHYLEAKLRKTLETERSAVISVTPISKQVSHLCLNSACILRGCLGSRIVHVAACGLIIVYHDPYACMHAR